MKRNDLILALVVIVLAFAVFFFLRGTQAEGAFCVITTDGIETERLSLSSDTEVTLSGYEGGFNHLVIRDGKAYLTDADCPDKLCVGQGTIHRDGESIICLPHRIVITIEGGSDSEVDMIAE